MSSTGGQGETVIENGGGSANSYSYVIVVIIIAALAAAAAAYYFLVIQKKDGGKKSRVTKDIDVDEAVATNTVGLKDIGYIASKLAPDSTHLDVLFAVASTPESILWGTKAHLKKEKLIQDRLEEEKRQKDDNKKSSSSKASSSSGNMFDLDDEGWANEDDDIDEEAKEKAKLAKEAEEQKKKEREQLKQATGKVKILLEDVDEAVIGQKWVESTLEKAGAWPPPDLRFLKDMTFEYDGKQVSALDHPGLRRNLCHIAGRINSIALNSHPDLMEAASQQKLDNTYFKASAEFRQRCAMLLEASLRTAIGFRNFPLAQTIVETVSIFRIGCKSPQEVEWFDGVMMKSYGAVPRIQITNTSIENPKEKEMATDDILLISLDLARDHTEAFTRQKIAMAQKQGIPPQIALQNYREGWWYFVRGKRLDGPTSASDLPISTEGILSQVEAADVERFQEARFDERLLTAWPMIVQQINQKSGKVKIQFKAPKVPGKYKFTVAVKSQDFLGADQEFSVEADIVDAATLNRTPKEESSKDSDHDEGKKDK